MGDLPVRVDGVAMKTASEVIVESSGIHRVQAFAEHDEGLGLAMHQAEP